MNKLKLTICFVIFAVVAAANPAVFGQFPKIKIPKIPRPNQTPPQTSTNSPENPVSAENPSATTAKSGGVLMDDAFTWFEAVSLEESGGGALNDKGWVLSSHLRRMGEYPPRSAFKVSVSRGGKIIGTTRCRAYPLEFKSREFAKAVHTVLCEDKTKPTKELGKFDVEVIFINGETDAETPVRKYKIEVLKADQLHGNSPYPPKYYISRHAEAPVSILFFRPKGAYPYSGIDERASGFGSGENSVEIYFNLSPNEKGLAARGSYARCTIDGKPLELQNDKIEIAAERTSAVVYTDRLAEQYKRGTEYRDEIRFSLMRVDLPFTYGAGKDAFETNVSNHPGNWECSLVNNGTTWRTWRWIIGRDGMAVKHAEQNGNVNLFANSFLIEMEIPAGGSLLDKRLAPVSAAQGFFYGQPWTSAEGKAMAAKVPTKGNAAPVASNKIK